MSSSDRPLIIGHRGDSVSAPENTLAAFALALQHGADGVEFDVRLAADGVPVVIHDPTLRRTASGEGIVERMTSVELARQDAGSWFNQMHPRRARDDYAREAIPTLEKVLGLFTSRGLVYVELKTDQAEQSTAQLVRAVIEVLKARKISSRAVVVSFNLDAIALIKGIDGTIRTGALFEPRTRPSAAVLKRRMIAAALKSGADEILFHRLMARGSSARLAIENGLRPVVWTVDDASWVARAKKLGFHAVITNDPGAFRKAAAGETPEK